MHFCKIETLFRKGNSTHPPLNKQLIKEYEQYVKDIYGPEYGIDGPPEPTKDPRPEMSTCLEKTVRSKIEKMTYLHIYFQVKPL